MKERILYLFYLVEWKFTHAGKGCKGMTPAYYNEWFDNEYRENKTVRKG